MRYRLLGPTGLRVSECVLGAMTFGDPGGVGASIEESRRMVDLYADRGGNFIDTAVNYRNGESEEYLGELLAGRRERFVVGSKYTVSRDGSDPNAAGNHAKNLRHSLDLSLRRLRTDYIDLYWVHMWDDQTPIEETIGALDREVRAGRILYVGMSDAPAWVVARADTVARSCGMAPPSAVQVAYSLVQRDAERELVPMASALGLTVTAWSPLGGGLLTGKYDTDGRGEGRLQGQRPLDRHLRTLDVTREVARELGAEPAQVALAWLLGRPAAPHPILGARTTAQLKEKLEALNLTLSGEQLARLDRVSAIELGFPHDFIAETSDWVFGPAQHRLVRQPPRR
jgi:aryl-alcohol dehydrogenase-like predicted oxidoreductase